VEELEPTEGGQREVSCWSFEVFGVFVTS